MVAVMAMCIALTLQYPGLTCDDSRWSFHIMVLHQLVIHEHLSSSS